MKNLHASLQQRFGNVNATAYENSTTLGFQKHKREYRSIDNGYSDLNDQNLRTLNRFNNKQLDSSPSQSSIQHLSTLEAPNDDVTNSKMPSLINEASKSHNLS